MTAGPWGWACASSIHPLGVSLSIGELLESERARQS